MNDKQRSVEEQVAIARAAGASLVRVAAVIEDRDRVLLLARGGDGFLELTWQPPTVHTFANENHRDALHRGLAASTGLTITAIADYLGHHDHAVSSTELVRVLYFRVAVVDPHVICRASPVRHQWVRPDRLPGNTYPPPHQLAEILTSKPLTAGSDLPSAEGLRAHARGLYPLEAAADLLINHRTWLRRADFTSFVHAALGDPPMAYIDWSDAITALDAGQLPCSSGEGRVLRLAASIAGGMPVDLRDALTGLDRRNTDLLVQAIFHAAGRHP